MKRAGSEQQEGRDLPEVDRAAHRAGFDLRRDRGGIGVHAAHALGVVEARQDRVDGDTAAHELAGEGLEEPGEAGPRGVREDEVRDRLLHRDRRDRDHPAPPRLLHARHRLAAHRDRAEAVQLECRAVRAPIGGREVARRRAAAVGDQDVETTERVARGLHECGATLLGAHVGDERDGVVTDLRGRRIDTSAVAAADGNGHAVLREGRGGGEAQTL